MSNAAVNLDRFSHAPANELIRWPEPEQNVCEWCGKQADDGQNWCDECTEAERIYNMPFGQLLDYIQAQVDCYEQTIVYDGGYLQFHWLFDTELEAKKVARILKAREAKHWLHNKSVTFWIGVDRHGRLNFVES